MATALDLVLPERCKAVQEGGNSIGWAPIYWNIPPPQDLVVGTATKTIGLGSACAVGAARAVKDGRVLLLAPAPGDGSGRRYFPDLP